MQNRRTPSQHLAKLVQRSGNKMKEFNEAQLTNNYLIEQLIIARKQNEVLQEHIDKLQDDIKISSQLLNACVAWMS
jgi:hypothetical protein